MGKYELLALFPLTGTDDELKASAEKIAERIRASGGTVHGTSALQRGRLAYPVLKVRQGSYHAIQFEMDPKTVAELARNLTISGELLRFTVQKRDEFKAFVPTAPKPMGVRAPWAPRRPAAHLPPLGGRPFPAPAAAPATAAPVPPQAGPRVEATPIAPKVTMEEIDKRLEEILGE